MMPMVLISQLAGVRLMINSRGVLIPLNKGGGTMIKVKTFTCPIKIFQTKEELKGLDQVVNQFIEENSVNKVLSVNDATTTDDTGATIGLIRVVAYETS
jgi:hypothetical protein